jgi:hypothetical protein
MPSETQSAAAAFDALRVEVGALRADLHKLAKRIADTPAPDYDLTLGTMAKKLGSMAEDLNFILRTLPPAKLPVEIYLPHELHTLTKQAKAAAQELREAAGVVIKQGCIRWWLAYCGGMGVLVGLLLCLGTAALLPRRAGAWIAADIVGGDRWTAGEALMRAGNAAAFDRMMRLYQACPPHSLTELCTAAIAVKAAESR